MRDLNGSRIMVTGGTGSFGNALIDYLSDSGTEFIVYSRDESKQHDMYIARRDKSISYVIGDVRDKDKLMQSMRGVDYVMHCLTPDTMVMTNSTPKMIADIQVGDNVLTEKGRYRPVTAVMQRSIDDEIVEIRPRLSNKTIRVTKEHPVLVWAPTKKCPYSSRSWCNPACGKRYNCKRLYNGTTPVMKPASELKVGDFLMIPRLKQSSKSRDPKLCKLLGYYVAEGAMGSKHKEVYYNVRFCLNAKEEDKIRDVEDLCSCLYQKKPHRYYSSSNEVILTICGKDIAQQFLGAGVGAANKRVPDGMMIETEENIRAFLTGYFNGDGCQSNGKMSTVSTTLAYQLRLLFAKLGACVGLNRYDRKTCTIRDKSYRTLPHYCLSISKFSDVPELGLIIGSATNHRSYFTDDNYVYIRIRGVELAEYTGLVYNLAVEEDETYTAELFTVHNCAALKHVPTGEKWPEEVIKTNVIGTKNVIEAAEYCGVKTLVDLSTDKAAYPIGAYGMSKALAEKLVLAHHGNTVNVCLRYGNVLGSRGSIIPLFLGYIAQGKPITITNPTMTRFVLTLEEAVKLSLKCLFDGKDGELFIMKPPACKVKTIVEALELHFGKELEKQVIGIRPGEKMHEVLLTGAEVYQAVDEVEDGITYSRIPTQRDMDYYFSGENYVEPEPFSSDRAEQYDAGQVLDKLKEAKLL